MVERYWFFTWRTYGTWLPGEDGFVGLFRGSVGVRVTENAAGSEPADPMPGLAAYAASLLTHSPLTLTVPQSEVVERELLRTCGFRGWVPDAIAILPNHLHIAFGV